jgi:hypothetical protein
MGMFGAIGKALKAPAKPLNKMMGALPGGNSANKMMGKALPGLGIGPSPKSAPSPNPWAAAAQGVGQIGSQLGGGNMERPQPMPEMQAQAPAGPAPQGFQSSPMPDYTGGNQIPPEVQQQLEQQKAAGAMMGTGGGMGGPGIPNRPQPAQGNMWKQLAQQQNPQMGGGRPNMGRAVGGAMGKMFGR